MPSPHSSDVGSHEQAGSWEHFPHDADIGVRGVGETPAAAFEQGALALSAAITDLPSVEPLEAVKVQCEARDLELLFVEWLNALVFEMSTRGMIFARRWPSRRHGLGRARRHRAAPARGRNQGSNLHPTPGRPGPGRDLDR